MQWRHLLKKRDLLEFYLTHPKFFYIFLKFLSSYYICLNLNLGYFLAYLL